MSQQMSGNGTHVALQALIELRKQALHQPHIGIKKKLLLAGQKLTTVRGRGIEFDTTREYQAGDDIRSMAWRVTARSLKPHIKVYREEKERPVWLALDLSPSLYFGTRCMFKSVKSIMQAALTGWSSIIKRERIGAVINSTQPPQVFQPRSGEKYFLGMLNSLANASQLQPAFTSQNKLHQLLLSLQQHVRTGDLLHLYSDFMQFDAETETLILYLAERSQVILHFVYDPFEATPPPPNQYMVTNGKDKLQLNMLDAHNREQYHQLFQLKVKQLQQFSVKHQLTLNLYCTDEARELV